MASTLPNELIEKVVDEVVLQPEHESIEGLIACATAHSAFAPLCQKHIFRTARFVPEPSKFWGDTRTEVKDLYRRTKLLSRTLIQNPALGLYVKGIDFTVTTDSCVPNENLQDVFDALKSVPSANVTQFTVAYRPDWDDPGGDIRTIQLRQNANWFRGMASAFHHLQFKVFRLLRVWGFPLEALPGSLESLYIERGFIQLYALELPHPRPFIRLKTLGFTGHGTTVIQDLFESETRNYIDLRHIETLSGELRLFGMKPLLQSTVQLRELNISDQIQLRRYDYKGSNPKLVQCALGELNPSSFRTLSRLSLDVVYRFDEEDGEVLHEPYARICGPEFTQLVALQELDVHLTFDTSDSHILPGNHENYGSQWSRLPNLLVTPGAFPSLRRVAVRVSIEVWDGESPHYEEGQALANKIVENMSTFVYPVQFRSMDNLRSASGDLVNLSFLVEATVHPR